MERNAFLIIICMLHSLAKQIIPCICIQTPRKSQNYYSCLPRAYWSFGVKTGNIEAKNENEWHRKVVLNFQLLMLKLLNNRNKN